VAVLLVLAGCETGKPLPAAPKALEAELSARGLALRDALPALGMEGLARVESGEERKLEGRWKLIAVRGKVVELTVSAPLFNETVARLTATPETLRVWLKAPGKRNAHVYAGPRRQLGEALESQPWARGPARALIEWMDVWLAPASSIPSLGISGAREAGDSLALDFQREQGTARLQLRRRDGFPLLLETRPATDASLGCVAVRFSPERPLSPGAAALTVPREVQGEVRSCCTSTVVASWRLQVHRVRAEVDALPSLSGEEPKPRPLLELTQHEWFRRAGPIVSAHRAHLACPPR
jgi:hypothetical protein